MAIALSPPSFAVPSLYNKAKQILGKVVSRAKLLPASSVFLFRHALYQSQSLFVASYLAESPDLPYLNKIHGPEFLRTAPSGEWRSHLTELDTVVGDIGAQAKAAGVPLVVTLLPQRAQAAMVSRGAWPAGFDPYKLDNELRSMVASHGGTYVDILPELRDMPNSEQGFFPVDSHPNARGHAMLTELLTRGLTNGAVPVLGIAVPQKAVLEQGR